MKRPALEDDDEILMLRTGKGDRDAFRQLLERHLDRIVAFAARVLGDRSFAEDIAQETFLRLWTHARDWQPTAKLTTWMYRVALNLCLDRRRRPVPVPLAAAGDPPDTAPDATAAIAEDETARLVAAALAELPERQRAALVLSYYEGLSNAETAEVLGATVGGVEALLVRARRALREKLRPRLAAI